MSKREHGQQHRKSKHVNRSVSVSVKSEDDLYQILDNLTSPPFLLFLDGVQDPHNLGACLRTADAAGVNAVIAPKDRAVSLTSTVVEIASGGAENVPFVQVTNMARVIDDLKERGIWFVATSDKATQSIYEVDLKGPLAVVLGAEGKGVRRLTEVKSDFLVSIPMFGKVECLNVSVATGVCLFEAVRQRKIK
ncbi:MAG: 23S rRNA (guanosine(2251)-2'-O)-methyltransferase RlmB [Calditrichaeota bacterium]|nr:MAG: 23S rRNA (guanosine(2251)-2'-O)-methyltransferase RlmB [Calditrichota bacterium]